MTTENRTSQAVNEWIKKMNDIKPRSMIPEQLRENLAIAEKYLAMEKALADLSDFRFELSGDAETTTAASRILSKVVRDTANGALVFDPLA